MEEKQLTEKQLELLRKSNKTLAIMGLFRSGDEQVRYVVKRSGSQGGTVSPMANFFNEVKPELRCLTKGVLEVGDKRFYKYNLKTPLEADNTYYSQPILFDSPLLEGIGYLRNEEKTIQEQGKTVVKKLIEKLDHIAYFTHSNFSKSLLKIAKEYLYITVNLKEDEHLVSVAQWRNTFNSDHTLCSKILQYLTAYEPDEPEIETDLRQYLKSIKKENSDVSVYTHEQIKKLVEALVQCKTVMRKGDEEDVTWRKITEFKEFSWLEDYRGDSIYGLKHPGLGKNSFLAHYQSFIEASDEIHRLVRTQAIHPSIFCWLVSKYSEWDGSAETIADAASEMFEIGVKKQGDDRIRSETYEEQCKNRQIIKEAKVDEQFNEIEGDENYKQPAEIVKDNIYDVLLPERSFGRKALLKRAKGLFTFLSQMAGGKVGELLRENDKFNHLFVKYYRKILNTESDRIEDFQKELGNLAKTDREAREFQFNIEGFIEEVIEKAKQSETKDVVLKIKVKEAFISEFARESKTSFARRYLENKNEIESDLQLAEDLYDLRSGTEVSSQNMKAGNPALVLTELVMPDYDNVEEEVKKSRKERFEKELIAAAKDSGKKSISFTHTEASKKLDPGNYPIMENGEKKGEIEIQAGKDPELTLDNPSEANELNSEDAELKTKDDSENIKIVDLDIPLEEILPEEESKIRKIVEKDEFRYELLSETQDDILKTYSDKEEPELQRGLRALLLSEYILAAPEEATPLGREDLSNILGLMVDIIQHLGDLKNDKILDGVLREDVNLENLLQKINLSKYYPVTDNDTKAKDELSEIIQYQLALCQQLNNVENYLKEIAELRDFLEAIKRTDLEIVVLNTTLEKHAKEGYDRFLAIADSPSIVYLSSQASDTKNSSTITDSLNEMAKSIAEFIPELDNAETLQIPIFVSQENVANCSLPLVSAQQVELPELSSQKDGDLTVSSVIQTYPYLLLCAALMLNSESGVFGKLEKPSRTQVKKPINKSLKKSIKDGQTVVDVLRQVWLNSSAKLIDTLIFTKWLNVMILAKRSNPSEDVAKDVVENQFGNILEEYWKSPETRGAAFATIDALVDIPILVKKAEDEIDTPDNFGAAANLHLTYEFGTKLQNKTRIFDLFWKDGFVKLWLNFMSEDSSYQ